MSGQKSFADKTSADDKSIGFDYQYYYFLDRLLNLKSGQSVGLEVEDDVHVEFGADFLVLFQLKHTVRKAASGQPIALPELDADFWKTIHNWANVITDRAQGRAAVTEQAQFVRKTEFHLVTNKAQSKTNGFLALCEEFSSGLVDFSDVRAAAEALHNKTADADVKSYIASLLALDNEVAGLFLHRMRVQLSLDDVIGQVKSSIRDKFVDPTRIDVVFQRLDSRIRQDNFIAIKAGQPVIVSYEEFMRRYRNIFVDARSKSLPAPSFNAVLPSDIFSQLFIKRLLEIEALQLHEKEIAIDYTTQKLRIVRYLEAWVQSGDLLSDEVEALHEEVLRRWRNKFRLAFKRCNTVQELLDRATELLVDLQGERFCVGPSELDTSLSNGELYHLSDIGKMGWHRDWESM